MADEQYKWLNRETAERLLRGESLEAVDASARDQAERLSRTLGALSAHSAPAAGELPGEQAAMAAFRKARESTEAERTAAGRADGTSGPPVPGADAGLIRIAAPGRTGTPARRPRWARPVRLALAAVVTVGTVGGVAMAAGSGMLHTPFGPERPGPSASASADETSAAPLVSGSPQGGSGTPSDPGEPSGPGAHPGGASGEAAGPGDRTGGSRAPGDGDPSGTPGSRWKDAAAACRAIQNGRELEAGRRRALENLAGGSARVSRYCKVVLSAADLAGGSGSAGKGGLGGDGGKAKGKDGGGGKPKDEGTGDDEGHPGRGGHGHPGERGHRHPGIGLGDAGVRHGAFAPAPRAFAPAPRAFAPAPRAFAPALAPR